MAGLKFAYIGGVVYYHTPLDNAEHLDPRSLLHPGSYALSLARRFGNPDLDSLRGPNLVYWNQPLPGFVSYPESWALPIAAALLVHPGYDFLVQGDPYNAICCRICWSGWWRCEPKPRVRSS